MLYARRLLSHKVVMPGLCFPGLLSSYLRGMRVIKCPHKRLDRPQRQGKDWQIWLACLSSVVSLLPAKRRLQKCSNNASISLVLIWIKSRACLVWDAAAILFFQQSGTEPMQSRTGNSARRFVQVDPSCLMHELYQSPAGSPPSHGRDTRHLITGSLCCRL